MTSCSYHGVLQAKGRGRAVHVEAPDEEPQRRPAGKRGRN